MAKTKSSLISLSGKFGDVVHVNSKTHGTYARKAVVAGTNKNQAALKQQYTRTKYLNELASEINAIITANARSFKPTGFYRKVQSCLRKEPSNNRFLLLRQFKGMQIDPKYPLHRLGGEDIDVHILEDKIQVTVKVKHHPEAGRQKANQYCYEMLLITWDKNKNSARHTMKPSDWVDINGGNPKFTFGFERSKGTMHWLLILRKRLAVDGELCTGRGAEGMQVVDAGSLDEKDHALLKKREEEAAKAEAGKVAGKKGEEVERVKAEWGD